MSERIPDVYDKLFEEIERNNLISEWQATPEEALEVAFIQPQMVALYGTFSINTTLEEMAGKMGAIDYANNVLARKETKSPQPDVLYANKIKSYKEHIEYLRGFRDNREEYYAALVYDWICNGMEPTLKWVAPVLVINKIIDYNIETRQNIIRYRVDNALYFRASLEKIIEGYTLAHKVGELMKGKSFIEMLNQKQEIKSENKHLLIKAGDSEEDEINDTNNFLRSTIEDYLEPFNNGRVLIEPSYTQLIVALQEYFENGQFLELKSTITVGKCNMKKLGWALKELYFKQKPKDKLSVDYLRFAHKYISTFTHLSFDESDFINGPLYKVFTTKA